MNAMHTQEVAKDRSSMDSSNDSSCGSSTCSSSTGSNRSRKVANKAWVPGYNATYARKVAV